MTVRDALVADPRVLSARATVREAAELLLHPHVRSALVVDDGRLLGCVTERTIIAAVAAGADVRTLRAADVCSEDVTAVAPDVALDDALRLMLERDLDRLVVIDDDRFLGILPREPLVRRLAEDGAA